MEVIVFFGCLVLGFSLICGLIYMAELVLIYITKRCDEAMQGRAAKAQDIAQHSVTVEVD
ncbi:MAG: hypothetical protein JO316_22580 [Abitibacteriaceae bacterium]|nr:hypothetical protein [Abditibacteriaceae bacterium]